MLRKTRGGVIFVHSVSRAGYSSLSPTQPQGKAPQQFVILNALLATATCRFLSAEIPPWLNNLTVGTRSLSWCGPLRPEGRPVLTFRQTTKHESRREAPGHDAVSSSTGNKQSMETVLPL